MTDCQDGGGSHKTELLVSVRSAAEAHLALQAGVQWIDAKEPARGSLGAASADVWQAHRCKICRRLFNYKDDWRKKL